MRVHRLLLAAAAAAPALALATATLAQADLGTDAPHVAQEAAELARVRPLIEAEKLRPRFSGTWKVETYIPALRTVEGRMPPMTAAARRVYNRRIADRRAGKTDDPIEVCLRPGTPRSLYMDMPFIITQAPVKVTLYHQYQHVIRHVFLDGPLKTADLDEAWQGTSSGRWEGDTLVVETGGFNGELWLDEAGLPQSKRMMVTERIRLVDPNTLENTITINDPENYTAPWTTKVRFKRLPDDTIITEHNCSEKLLEFPLREYAPVAAR